MEKNRNGHLRIKPYLLECSFGGVKMVGHSERHADHGGESQQPAQSVAPPRVHILVIVLEGSVLNQGKGKCALCGGEHIPMSWGRVSPPTNYSYMSYDT